jgi:cyclase
MLRPRITPCLLIRNRGLVKTVRFADPKYVGDPVNAVKIFNEKECDELIALDIDASAQRRAPDFQLIRELAAECRMPLCYGGGIKTADQAKRITGLGVEKIAVSSIALESPEIVSVIAKEIGSQSVVVVFDVRKKGESDYTLWTYNGTQKVGKPLVRALHEAESAGAGEVLINSIDREGTMKGYDLELGRLVRDCTSIPMTMLGGAGSLADIGKIIGECGVIGAAAGSLFVFKGIYRAVLINYPTASQKEELVRGALGGMREPAIVRNA